MDVEHPAYAGFRFQLLIRCLQRWAKLAMYAKSAPKGRFYHSDFLEKIWSGRRDSNPRPQPWQGCALPLSYTRILAWPGSLDRRLAYMAQTVLECNKMLKHGRSILNGKCNADFRFRLKS